VALSFSRFIDSISEVCKVKNDCSLFFRHRIVVATVASWNIKDDPLVEDVEAKLNGKLTGRGLEFFGRVRDTLRRTADTSLGVFGDLWDYVETAKDIELQREAEGRPLILHECAEDCEVA